MDNIETAGSTKYKSVADIKKDTINILTNAYAGSNITVETLENALADIENAKSIEEIKNIYKELNINESELIIKTFESINKLEKITFHGSSRKIDNKALITKKIEIEMTHGKILLDYSNIHLPDGEYEVVFNLIHSKCFLLLPDDINIENRINEIYSKVKDCRKPSNISAKITIKMSGKLTHSKVIIKKIKKKGIE